MKGKSLVTILALSATFGLTACKGDIDKYNYAHKEQRCGPISVARIQPLPYEDLTQCEIESQELVDKIYDEIKDHPLYVLRAPEQEGGLLSQAPHDYNAFIDFYVDSIPYLGQGIDEELLCQAKAVGLRLNKKSSFEKDLFEGLVKKIFEDVKGESRPEELLGRAAYMSEFKDLTRLSIPHEPFLIVGKVMKEEMIEKISQGDVESIAKMAESYAFIMDEAKGYHHLLVKPIEEALSELFLLSQEDLVNGYTLQGLEQFDTAVEFAEILEIPVEQYIADTEKIAKEHGVIFDE